MLRTAVICAVVAAAALAVGIMVRPAADEPHTVRTALSPSTGQPVTGGGSWIVNKPSGYYLGRALPGERFADEQASPGGWRYGRASGTDLCGWVLPGAVGTGPADAAGTCPAGVRADIAHRLTIGRDFNAAAHAATDGTPVPANPACTVYLNYLHGTDSATNGGRFADPAGPAAASVRYRFTTRDGAAAVVRDPVRGWGFLPVGCVTRPSELHNDND